MPAPLNIALLGATGRMGQEIAAIVRADKSLHLIGASTHDQHSHFGLPLFPNGPVLATAQQAIKNADVAIDFSISDAAYGHAQLCAQSSVAYLCGITALPSNLAHQLHNFSSSVPILCAPNMSVGVNICLLQAEELAKQLGGGFKVLIHDIHHAAKLDAPSGTALEFGRLIQAAVSEEISIEYSNVREGLHAGEHHVRFTKGQEVIELRHVAGSRTEFACGAVRVARWLAKQPPGCYSMRNLLKITTS